MFWYVNYSPIEIRHIHVYVCFIVSIVSMLNKLPLALNFHACSIVITFINSANFTSSKLKSNTSICAYGYLCPISQLFEHFRPIKHVSCMFWYVNYNPIEIRHIHVCSIVLIVSMLNKLLNYLRLSCIYKYQYEWSYRISANRRRGVYLFRWSVWCGDYSRAASIRGRRLFF